MENSNLTEEKDVSKHIISIIVGVFEQTLERQKTMNDPVIRHIIFLEKLLLTMDIILTMLKEGSIKLSNSMKTRIDNVVRCMNNEIVNLQNWVQTPVYSPNHPFGEKMMKYVEEDFNNKK